MPASDQFTRHGPVRVSQDRTHLAHADGTPFFFLADTAWNGALLSTEADWATYLDDRQAKNITAIQFVTHAPWSAALTNREGLTAFTGDPRNPVRADFFDLIDRRIEMINARGMLAVPVLAWAANFGKSGKLNVGHCAGAAELIEIVRYQVNRFARHHVLWVLAGDGVYNFWRSGKWKRVGRAIFADRPDHAPVALHPAGGTWPYERIGQEKWLDVAGYQSSHSEHPKILRWLQSGPPSHSWKKTPRPTINLEPVYEGIAPVPGQPPFDRAAVRRAIYWSLLNAPTAGVAYGAHGVWSWTETAAEPLNHAGMGIAQPWHAALNFPGSDDMKRVADLFASIPWWTLRPAPELVAAQPIPNDPAGYVAASCSHANDVAMIYLPRGGDVTLSANRLNGCKMNWFDPRTGQRREAYSHSPNSFIAPTQADWVLLASKF